MDEQLVCIRNYPNGTFAEMARQQLEAQGIYCILQVAGGGAVSQHMIGGLPPWGTQGVDLYAQPEEADRAKNILIDF